MSSTCLTSVLSHFKPSNEGYEKNDANIDLSEIFLHMAELGKHGILVIKFRVTRTKCL